MPRLYCTADGRLAAQPQRERAQHSRPSAT
jgi:hypothetical protein